MKGLGLSEHYETSQLLHVKKEVKFTGACSVFFLDASDSSKGSSNMTEFGLEEGFPSRC